MGRRTNVDITFQIGKDNSLTNLQLEESLQQLLDTLEHATVYDVTLDALETNHQVPFGDVAGCRLLYIEADGAIRVTPGGGTATSASLSGSSGSYPTGFTGVNENLDLEIDGVTLSVAFTSGDQSIGQVINRINAAAALAGITGPGGVPVTIAKNTGTGQLKLFSSTTGTSSTVEVVNTSASSVLTALGLTATSNAGVNASPGQTPITLLKPADTTGSDLAAGVKTFLFGTIVTSALTIDSLDADNPVKVLVAVVGDLTPLDPC